MSLHAMKGQKNAMSILKDMKDNKVGRTKRRRHKTALQKLLDDTKEAWEKKLDASDRRMNDTAAEMLALKRKLQEQRRAHAELVKEHEKAETKQELLARLASVGNATTTAGDDGDKAAAAASKTRKGGTIKDSGLGSSIDSIAEETVNKRIIYKLGVLNLHPPLKLNSDSEIRWKDIPTMFHF
ncbi:hypothetical protein NEUTE1DRAFT_117607 [Neurospora tetrasperma FGSC 2508]|uniref:Uncharacterized protein n=1 Tax=Neurospora tetrasperma (strain FGSC 2508 / ATCC MYA-4615 / P0657) TaxID=510951 RepID=F8MPR7_NEUT8|nr:uncharacterized protein NEUTE1DRAFT_117607 [Neurospora tetrasperma FGSC 2508]EGO57172.1 hypothetical protein NEUTE1DRAFT_117607 [Neurospora tetrasperma FGSC 2508]EGZ69909.1 hypothetical protein NEUTE2DRAFT_144876 [Neurospora tetrasperma FGSC 2509]